MALMGAAGHRGAHGGGGPGTRPHRHSAERRAAGPFRRACALPGDTWLLRPAGCGLKRRRSFSVPRPSAHPCTSCPSAASFLGTSRCCPLATRTLCKRHVSVRAVCICVHAHGRVCCARSAEAGARARAHVASVLQAPRVTRARVYPQHDAAAQAGTVYRVLQRGSESQIVADNTGGAVYDAAIVLSRYLAAKEADDMAGKSVLVSRCPRADACPSSQMPPCTSACLNACAHVHVCVCAGPF